MQYEEDIKQRIENGENARDILLAEFPKAEQQLKKHTRAINKLFAEVKDVFPDADLYIGGSETLYLCLYPQFNLRAEPDKNSVAVKSTFSASGGDW